jgi:MinD-like ATPase involved in chromosome partitioning or flagellar assembly
MKDRIRMTIVEPIPTLPHVTATFRDDDNVEVTFLGTRHVFEGSASEARTKALQFLWTISASEDFNRPLRIQTDTVDGAVSSLIVTPDGRFYDERDPAKSWPLNSPDAAEAVIAAGPVGDLPEGRPIVKTPGGTRLLAGPSVPRHHERKSFIADGPIVAPAHQGWRGAANRIGMRLEPGVPEVSWRADARQVSQHWAGPRTIAVVNGKGSANKTPTTVMLSAVLARYGGAGVLAWDNNETRGSLAWRTQRSNHTSTVLDLLPQTNALLGTGAQSSAMSYFAHHQPEDKFDVLHSDQSVDGEHEVSGAEVEAIHRVAAKYYRMIIMDSGNNERAVNWREMIRHTQQLVVPCTNVEDTAEAGARMLEALSNRDDHSRKLAQNAVAIISKRTPGRDPNMDRIVRDFTPLVREVVTIPYDKALISGIIHFDSMQAETKRAWLRAAAAVARGL